MPAAEQELIPIPTPYMFLQDDVRPTRSTRLDLQRRRGARRSVRPAAGVRQRRPSAVYGQFHHFDGSRISLMTTTASAQCGGSNQQTADICKIHNEHDVRRGRKTSTMTIKMKIQQLQKDMPYLPPSLPGSSRPGAPVLAPCLYFKITDSTRSPHHLYRKKNSNNITRARGVYNMYRTCTI